MLAAGAGTVPGRAGIANDMLNLAAHGVVAGRSSSAHGVVNGSEGVALSSEDESVGSARSGITGTTGSVRSTPTRLTEKGRRVRKPEGKRRHIYNDGGNIPVRLKLCHQQLQCLICSKSIYTKANVPAHSEFGKYFPWYNDYKRGADGNILIESNFCRRCKETYRSMRTDVKGLKSMGTKEWEWASHPTFLELASQLLGTTPRRLRQEKGWDVQLHGDKPKEPTIKAFVAGQERVG